VRVGDRPGDLLGVVVPPGRRQHPSHGGQRLRSETTPRRRVPGWHRTNNTAVPTWRRELIGSRADEVFGRAGGIITLRLTLHRPAVGVVSVLDLRDVRESPTG
jgi:hypothetical protein